MSLWDPTSRPNGPIARWATPMRTMALLYCVVAIIPQNGFSACGLQWEIPRGPHYFENVTRDGIAVHGDRFGSMELTDGSTLPLNAVWRADWNYDSPHTGMGVSIGFLDSRFIQVSETQYVCHQPNAWLRHFWKDQEHGTLKGQGGWLGEHFGRNNENVRISAPCGTSIEYRRGRIHSFQTKDFRLDYVWQDDRVAEIRENGRTVLKTEIDPETRLLKTILVRRGVLEERINVKYGRRPIITKVGGQKMVSGVEPALEEVIFPDGRNIRHEFAVDDDMNPTFAVINPRRKRNIDLMWDNDTKFLRWQKIDRERWAIREWKYEIAQGEDNAVEITRTNLITGTEQKWGIEPALGRHYTQSRVGSFKEKVYYVSGPLRGNPRRIVTTKPTGVQRVRLYRYDERGGFAGADHYFQVIDVHGGGRGERVAEYLKAKIDSASSEKEKDKYWEELLLFNLEERKDLDAAVEAAKSLNDYSRQTSMLVHIINRHEWADADVRAQFIDEITEESGAIAFMLENQENMITQREQYEKNE